MLTILDFRNRYVGVWSAFGEAVGIVLGLVIYWYTAKAFAPAFAPAMEKIGTDYFSFVLIGELTLLLPMQLLDGFSRQLRQSASHGTLDSMLALPVRPQTAVVLMGLAAIPRDILRIIVTLVVAVSFFGLQMNAIGLALAVLLQILALPAFIGLAMLAASFIMVLGRGHSLLSHLGNIAAVIAGAYFPVSVLPESIQVLGQSISPFNALLDATRLALAGQWSDPVLTQHVLFILAGAVSLLPLGFWSLAFALESIRRRGASLLFTS